MNPETEMFKEMLLMPLMFIFFAWLIHTIWEGKKNKLKSQLHHKLVDKFDNVEEMNNFLQSPTGNKFLDSLSIDGLVPKEKLLSGITRGIVMGFLGIAFIVLGFAYPDENRFYFTTGIIIITLCVGFLVSAGVSIHLSKKWGILDREKE